MNYPSITFTIEAEFESDIRPEDAFEDENGKDQELIQGIYARLAVGDTWAWASVEVTAEIEFEGHKFYGTDYLGGCSYENEEDFKRCDYYADLKKNAYDQLLKNLEAKRIEGNRAGVALCLLPKSLPEKL
jgi:hypothetical protein